MGNKVFERVLSLSLVAVMSISTVVFSVVTFSAVKNSKQGVHATTADTKITTTDIIEALGFSTNA